MTKSTKEKKVYTESDYSELKQDRDYLHRQYEYYQNSYLKSEEIKANYCIVSVVMSALAVSFLVGMFMCYNAGFNNGIKETELKETKSKLVEDGIPFIVLAPCGGN